MTIDQIIKTASNFNLFILVFFLVIPLFCILLRFIHKRDQGHLSPWKYYYSVLVYLSCIPGMFSSVLTGYALLFIHENLLKVNALVYFLPVVSMVASLLIIRKSVTFDEIPGFKKLYGLILLLAATFIIAFILDKIRIWIFFGGSVFWFFIACVALFFVLKYSARLLLGAFKKKESSGGSY
ncbi:MAG: hypothetical protein JXJ04_20300 [Spirochaetales bacterium]|nr:hypothetical protein [Spirochaetales bacterium]